MKADRVCWVHVVDDVNAALAGRQLCGFPLLLPCQPESVTTTNRVASLSLVFLFRLNLASLLTFPLLRIVPTPTAWTPTLTARQRLFSFLFFFFLLILPLHHWLCIALSRVLGYLGEFTARTSTITSVWSTSDATTS